MYETRDDMERLPPDAANPNAFSETITRLCNAYNDANPRTGKLLAATLGPDILKTYLRKLLLAVFTRVGIMAPRRGLTTDTLSVALVVSTSPAAACSQPWLASFTNLLFGKLMSNFLNGLSSVTSNLLQEGTVHRFHAL